MALVTRHEQNVYALVLNKEQSELLRNAFCSRLATHCINVKLRELNQEEDKFDRKWFKTQKPHVAVTQVGVIVERNVVEKLQGVQFFDNKELAIEKLKKYISKTPDAGILPVALFMNVPKAEQQIWA